MAQFTTAEVAEKFETTPRTLRKFLRADAKANGAADSLPGKGSRYAIEGKALQGMKKRFNAWQVEQAEERKARAEKAAEDAKLVEVTEAILDEVETDFDELENPMDDDPQLTEEGKRDLEDEERYDA